MDNDEGKTAIFIDKTPVIIRKAVLADIDSMLPLLNSLFSIESDFCFDEIIQRKGLEMFLDGNDTRCIMVATHHKQIMGMASVQTVISTAEGGKAGLVEDVVVAPEWRRRGIGCGLLNAIEAWARANGLKRLQLLADNKNDSAISFYRHSGWQTTQLVCIRKKGF